MNDNGTQPNVSADALRKVMAQINQLLALADDAGATPAEADRARERAERLMERYRIDEASLSVEERAHMGIKPVDVEWDVCPLDSEFSKTYRAMASQVVYHVGGRAVSKYAERNGTTWIVYRVFGYQSDLSYGEAIWNSIRIGFAGRLEPKVDPRLSDEDNVYAMRMAGMERVRIADAMGWPYTGSAHAKVTRMFKAACKARGEDPAALLGRSNNVGTFRQSYAESFQSKIWQRLYWLRSTRGADSAALVLANREAEVDEALYTAYPHLRPVPVDHQVESNAKTQTDCPKCKKAKSGYCRDHAWLKPSTARDTRPHSLAGATMGRAAADSINISAGGGSLER